MSRMAEHVMEHDTSRDAEDCAHFHQMEKSMLNEIAKALAAAQADMKNPTLDATNPHFRNKFASLAGVRNAVVPVLAKHGISLTQDLRTTERGVAVTTILTHASGQQMTFGPLEMPAMKQDAQGFGSAATYGRRYALMAACGVVGDEDDDAEQAVTRKPEPSRTVDPRGEAHKSVDPQAVAKYVARATDVLAQDKEEHEIADDVRAIHLELSKEQDLYIAVGDKLAADGVIGKAGWRKFVTMAAANAGQQRMAANGRA